MHVRPGLKMYANIYAQYVWYITPCLYILYYEWDGMELKYILAGICFSSCFLYSGVCYLIRWWYSFAKHIRSIRRKYTKPKILRTVYHWHSWQYLTVHWGTTLKFPRDIQCSSQPISLKFLLRFPMYRGDFVQIFKMDVRDFCCWLYVNND